MGLLYIQTILNLKIMNNSIKKAEGYKYSITAEERKDLLNKSINRRVAKRFINLSNVERFYLTTLFL